MKPYLLVSLFLLLSLTAFAQKSKHIKLGDRFYTKFKDYYTAISHYDRAYKLMEKSPIKNAKKRARFFYRYAECNRYTYNFTKAEMAYAQVYESGDAAAYPKLNLYYAYTLKHNGKYDEAAEGLQKFLEQNKLEEEERAKAEQELKSCAVAKDLVARGNMDARIEALGSQVNTRFSDFSPVEVDDELYYSSLRFERRPTKNRRIYYTKDVNKHLVGKIMYSKGKGEGRGVLLNELNKKYQSAGNVTLSPDGQYLFFTICKTDHPDRPPVCAIHYAPRYKGRGTGRRWADPVALPAPINLEEYTSTHPSIGYDSLLGKQILVFVSNRPGGVGNSDLWMAVFEGDTTLGEPMHMGPILNTVEEEATPFFHTPTQTLYFSSKWHEGLGGYDVFYTRRTGSDPRSWSPPVNAGVPLNSAANDIYFVINKDDTTGYFASNRVGSIALTGESCCNDLYRINVRDLVDKVKTPVLDTPKPQIDTPVVVRIDTVKTPVEPPVVQVDTPVVVAQVDTPKTPVTPVAPVAPEPSPEEKINELNTLLPLSLYFHDDEPDPNTLNKEASVAYNLTHQNYLDMKDEYLQQYQGNDTAMQNQLDAFFEDKVFKNFSKTGYLLDELGKVLDKGIRIELSMRGFTSARGAAKYNLNLAKRRIDCVKKEILEHGGGKLRAYVESGQLILKELPFGENEARSTDKNRRDAVFSVHAAEDRRVQLIAVEIKNN